MKKINLLIALLSSLNLLAMHESSISELILSSYLKNRRDNMQGMNIDKRKALFDNLQVTREISNDVDISASADQGFITLNTTIKGTPEDFLGEKILDAEKGLLKYVLITQYLSERNKLADDPVVVILDQHTKSNSKPAFMVLVEKIFGRVDRQSVCTDRKYLSLVSTFTIEEFNQAIDKYFVIPEERTPAWFEIHFDKVTFIAGVATGVWLAAMVVSLFKTKNPTAKKIPSFPRNNYTGSML